MPASAARDARQLTQDSGQDLEGGLASGSPLPLPPTAASESDIESAVSSGMSPSSSVPPNTLPGFQADSGRSPSPTPAVATDTAAVGASNGERGSDGEAAARLMSPPSPPPPPIHPAADTPPKTVTETATASSSTPAPASTWTRSGAAVDTATTGLASSGEDSEKGPAHVSADVSPPPASSSTDVESAQDVMESPSSSPIGAVTARTPATATILDEKSLSAVEKSTVAVDASESKPEAGREIPAQHESPPSPSGPPAEAPQDAPSWSTTATSTASIPDGIVRGLPDHASTIGATGTGPIKTAGKRKERDPSGTAGMDHEVGVCSTSVAGWGLGPLSALDDVAGWNFGPTRPRCCPW